MHRALQTVEESTRYATIAETAAELARLSSADLARLEKIARGRASGLSGASWEDLLQEAATRILEGTRRWPRDIAFIAFVAQTMRSIASDNRRRDSGVSHALGAADEIAAPDSGHLVLEHNQALERIEQLFATDAAVLALLDGLAEGESAVETQRRTGLAPNTYDAARKRFWRGIAKLNGDRP